MKKRWQHIFTLAGSLALIATALRLVYGEDPQIQLNECATRVESLGTAMEMYATDWSGHYPERLDKSVPNYLDALPYCPVAGVMTYKMEHGPEAPHNEDGFQDYYYLYCAGEYHSPAGTAKNLPAYDGCGSVHFR